MRDMKKRVSIVDRLRTITIRGTEKGELSDFWKGIDKYQSALGGIIRL